MSACSSDLASSHPSSIDSRSLVADSIGTDRKASAKARHAAFVRASSKRRRFVDPATCEKDYSDAELEFMNAMQAYKQATGTQYPSWGEVLGVLRSLGYAKPTGPFSAT